MRHAIIGFFSEKLIILLRTGGPFRRAKNIVMKRPTFESYHVFHPAPDNPLQFVQEIDIGATSCSIANITSDTHSTPVGESPFYEAENTILINPTIRCIHHVIESADVRTQYVHKVEEKPCERRLFVTTQTVSLMSTLTVSRVKHLVMHNAILQYIHYSSTTALDHHPTEMETPLVQPICKCAVEANHEICCLTFVLNRDPLP